MNQMHQMNQMDQMNQMNQKLNQMKKRKQLKMAVQVLFAVLFFVLLTTDNLRPWRLIFIAGILLAPLLGRVYCGWICPIHTGSMLVTVHKKKSGRKPIPVPAMFKAPWIRYAMAVLFLAAVILGERVLDRQIPVLLIFFVLGLVLTYFYQEAFIHRFLCPYGAILKLAAFRSKRAVAVNPERCQGNGDCEKACPTGAVHLTDGKASIESSECLVCLRCVMNCKEKAIAYRH